MKCPFDETDLKTIERNGIEIDWCQSCKGVWLERGELDKILDRASYENGKDFDEFKVRTKPEYYREEKFRSDHQHHDRYPKKKKKSNFLSEIFEF